MFVSTVNISSDATLDCYVQKQSNELRRNRYQWQPKSRPAILIIPGGGYLNIADSENEPLAITYLAAGYNAFVLNYSTGDKSEYPTPLIEASKAIIELRKNCIQYNIDPNKIVVCGLSAGAHLAGLLATQYFTPLLTDTLGVSSNILRPDALIFAYPLFDLKLYNDGVEEKGKIFGKMLWDEKANVNSLDNIHEEMPPVFIWHTRDDPIVPSNQSLMLATKLAQFGIPYELHMFNIGDHGLSTCNGLSLYGKIGLRDYPVNVDKWVEMSINWVNSLFDFDEFDPDKYK